jgi:hypothetical protein
VRWRVLDKTNRLVAVRLRGDGLPSIRGFLLDDPQWWRGVKLSQPWGQRDAYEPQKGIEVDALGGGPYRHQHGEIRRCRNSKCSRNQFRLD